MTLFVELADTTAAVGAAAARNAKRDALAALLRRLDPDEVAPAIGMLVGDPRQGRIGVGWATVSKLDVDAATIPSLTIGDVDRALTAIASTTGSGSQAARAALLTSMLAAATGPEQQLLRRLLTGEMRQGALEGVLTDAVAVAAEVPATTVRRAVMLSGDLGRAAVAALTGGRPALDAIGLTVGNPVQPMLASTADGVADAMGAGDLRSVEWKLDGARIQVHRDGDDVSIFTRNLNDVTHRLPGVIEVVRSLPARRLILDGEVLGFVAPEDIGADDAGGREPEAVPHAATPGAFQDTMSSFGRDAAGAGAGLRPYFFDLLHADGTDLVDEPLTVRIAALAEITGPHRIPGIVTTDAGDADAFLAAALAAGHEGVMVKDATSPYAAGRRGKAWRKVKPVHVVDLVVLAAEWGHGRRTGWLSNLHLGARDPASPGSYVMVGKTFKGLTDALLTWQTEQLLAREIGRDGIVVHVRPELVVEVGLDGVQVSTRYPGGVALRFARVRRYRPDKSPAGADTLDALTALLPRARRDG